MNQDHSNIVLAGLTGSGKSSTGNTLVGERVFQDSDSHQSCTLEVQHCDVTVGPQKLRIIDVIGFADTRLDAQGTIQKWIPFYDRAAGGVDMFLFVFNASTRWTGVSECLQLFEENCGADVWRRTIMVGTFCPASKRERKRREYMTSELSKPVMQRAAGLVLIDNLSDPDQARQDILSEISSKMPRTKWSNGPMKEALAWRQQYSRRICELPLEYQSAPQACLKQVAEGRCTRQAAEEELKREKENWSAKQAETKRANEEKSRADTAQQHLSTANLQLTQARTDLANEQVKLSTAESKWSKDKTDLEEKISKKEKQVEECKTLVRELEGKVDRAEKSLKEMRQSRTVIGTVVGALGAGAAAAASALATGGAAPAAFFAGTVGAATGAGGGGVAGYHSVSSDEVAQTRDALSKATKALTDATKQDS